MNCDLAQRSLSARLDGELHGSEAVAADEHVAGCTRCRTFLARAERVRAAVRIRPAEPVPDLVARIVGQLDAVTPARSPVRRLPGAPLLQRWRRAMQAAAALVVGIVVGSVLVGGPFRARNPDAISANAIVRGVRGASPQLDSFGGTFEVVERGLAADVPVRRFGVRALFLAPQRFRLDVVDRTTYPSASWIPSDVTYVENVATTFRSGPTGCPTGLPEGSCPATRTTVTRGSTLGDLMVPATTFGSARGFRVLGTDSVDGREVVHVQLTFAKATPMLPFLWLDDTWRPFFPGDRVVVALDAESWLPRRIVVFPAATQARGAWELRFGLPAEDPSRAILEVAATSVTLTAPDRSLFEIPGEPHEDLSIADLEERLGYRPAAPLLTGDLELASSIAPRVRGHGPRWVLVYANGLDYLRLSELSGAGSSVDPLSREVVLPGGAPASFTPAGRGEAGRLVIHGERTNLLLESNLPMRAVLEIAGSIPMRNRGAP